MTRYFVTRESCPVCESRNHTIVRSLPFSDDRIWPFLSSYYQGRISEEILKSQNYCVAQCRACGLLYQVDVMNDAGMFLLYEKWISADESLNKKQLADFSLFRRYAGELEGICTFFRRAPHEISVLDFGMGWGFWANLAKACNFDITGLELSPARLAFARQTGLRVIDDLSAEPNERYDYIYTNQVFEHLPNPKSVIMALREKLRGRGIIHIQVPDGQGAVKVLKSPNWRACKDALSPLEHINCFNASAMRALASSAGLKLLPPPLSLSTSGLLKGVKGRLRHILGACVSTEVYLTKNA